MKTTYTPPEQEISKCVRIPADNVHLLGDLQVPEMATSLVIFAFDYGRCANHPRPRHIARVLRDHGLGTLLCDLLTEDEEAEDEVTEKYRHDADFLSRRLIAVTKWATSNPDTKKLRLTYFGASAGGAAALIAAAKLPKKVCAVVTRGCRADLAKKSLPHVLCPTLLIVGEDDTVDVELNREGLALLGGRKELQVIPGASHLFGEPGKLEIMSQMSAEWFRRFAVPDHR
jgi:putative phosphoribosyl transferase